MSTSVEVIWSYNTGYNTCDSIGYSNVIVQVIVSFQYFHCIDIDKRFWIYKETLNNHWLWLTISREFDLNICRRGLYINKAFDAVNHRHYMLIGSKEHSITCLRVIWKTDHNMYCIITQNSNNNSLCMARFYHWSSCIYYLHTWHILQIFILFADIVNMIIFFPHFLKW